MFGDFYQEFVVCHLKASDIFLKQAEINTRILGIALLSTVFAKKKKQTFFKKHKQKYFIPKVISVFWAL